MKLIYKIILGILICIFIVFYWLSNITEGEYYRRHSPDGQYSIYASRNKYFDMKIPFSKFSDTGGKIHLYDELENIEIGSFSISMISNINELGWSETELYEKAHNYIKLPRKIHFSNKRLPTLELTSVSNTILALLCHRVANEKAEWSYLTPLVNPEM